MSVKTLRAGMSGGIAYVLADEADEFKALCNTEMIEFEPLENDEDISEVRNMVLNHFDYTESVKANYVLDNWDEIVKKFVKVIPKDYKRMMKSIQEQKAAGLNDEEAK